MGLTLCKTSRHDWVLFISRGCGWGTSQHGGNRLQLFRIGRRPGQDPGQGSHGWKRPSLFKAPGRRCTQFPDGRPPEVRDHKWPQLLWVRTSELLGSCGLGSGKSSGEGAALGCGPFVHGRTSSCCSRRMKAGPFWAGFSSTCSGSVGASLLDWGDCQASGALFHCGALCCYRKTWTHNGTWCILRQPALLWNSTRLSRGIHQGPRQPVLLLTLSIFPYKPSALGWTLWAILPITVAQNQISAPRPESQNCSKTIEDARH